MEPTLGETYAVRLPDFEGPLDVLLRLIERQEMEISKIALALVADQFLAYVAALPTPQPAVLASFMVVVAKLLLIKSEALLPRPPPPVTNVEEEEDVGAELVRRLEEYRAVQQVARTLRERDDTGQHSFTRPASIAGRKRPVQRPPTLGLEGVSLGQLSALVNRRLQMQMSLDEPPAIIPHEITLAEKVAELEGHLDAAGPGGVVPLWPLLLAAGSRAEVVITFMAVLEILRRHQAHAEQSEVFGDILLRRTASPAPPLPT